MLLLLPIVPVPAVAVEDLVAPESLVQVLLAGDQVMSAATPAPVGEATAAAAAAFTPQIWRTSSRPV